MLDWIKKGLSDDVGNMDEARIAACALVLTFIGVSIAMLVTTPATFSLKDFGIGGAALAGGIGGWFKFRGTN